MRLHSTEQVTRWHPDKYADQISDAILTACIAQDANSRVACETLVKDDAVVIAGEITTKAKIDYEEIVERVAKKLGYKVRTVLTRIDEQSTEIAQGVGSGDTMCAGDQGMMYGYACDDTESLLPYGFDLANRIITEIERHVLNDPATSFMGDAKCQVTVDLDEKPDAGSVKKILVSACHKKTCGIPEVWAEVYDILWDLGIDTDAVEVIVNPAGEWTVGGPNADCGLTGRKIVCDQYGGYCPVGGGAFSGKDPSKVDRSGSYIARQIACEIVRIYGVKTCEVQIAYAIGQAEPMSINIRTNKRGLFDAKVTKWVRDTYDLTPAGIIKYLDLLNKDYEKISEGCHYREGGIA